MDTNTNIITSFCPRCGNPNDAPMGVLGNLLWFRCRYCGCDFSVEVG
jgi:hypothetical protein